MRPRKTPKTLEIFIVRLIEIMGMSHPLVKLTETMNWENLQEELAETYSENMGSQAKRYV